MQITRARFGLVNSKPERLINVDTDEQEDREREHGRGAMVCEPSFLSGLSEAEIGVVHERARTALHPDQVDLQTKLTKAVPTGNPIRLVSSDESVDACWRWAVSAN